MPAPVIFIAVSALVPLAAAGRFTAPARPSLCMRRGSVSFNEAARSLIFTVEQYDLNGRIALAYRLAEFLGIEVRQTPVKKERLPESLLQVNQCFGASARLLNATRSWF
ncbi:MAG: hypothetical protein WCC04_08755 [Terriglobales bacterium]